MSTKLPFLYISDTDLSDCEGHPTDRMLLSGYDLSDLLEGVYFLVTYNEETESLVVKLREQDRLFLEQNKLDIKAWEEEALRVANQTDIFEAVLYGTKDDLYPKTEAWIREDLKVNGYFLD